MNQSLLLTAQALAAGDGGDDEKAEARALAQEADMPLEELLALYGLNRATASRQDGNVKAEPGTLVAAIPSGALVQSQNGSTAGD